jgi:hypothetical protein
VPEPSIAVKDPVIHVPATQRQADKWTNNLNPGEFVAAATSVLANVVWVCQTWRMAEKRTKVDKSQRQADQLEKRAESRPEQTRKKTNEEIDQAPGPITRHGE